MTLRKGLGYYVAGVVAVCFLWLLLGLLAGTARGVFWPFPVLLVGYLAVGYALNVKVLRELCAWHPAYNTLENVSRTKQSMLIFWPIRYPLLFFRLLVNRHL